MRPAPAIWLAAAVLYGAFWLWYYAPGSALTAEEVEEAVRVIGERAGAEDRAALREFLEADDGGDFVMVNAIELRDPPGVVEGEPPAASAGEMLDRYMAYMWPELLKRACHPVVAGRAVAPALDIWGIEGGERWSQAGLMRYRSRRDLLEIALNDAFRDSHRFKVAAMAKTIAFPISPFVVFGGVPLVVLLAIVAIAALLHLLLATRRGRGTDG